MAMRFDEGKANGYRSIRLRDTLVEKGWLVEVENSHSRRSNGQYAATRYWVLAHEQWVARHGKTPGIRAF
jgi:hypothetical protein